MSISSHVLSYLQSNHTGIIDNSIRILETRCSGNIGHAKNRIIISYHIDMDTSRTPHSLEKRKERLVSSLVVGDFDRIGRACQSL